MNIFDDECHQKKHHNLIFKKNQNQGVFDNKKHVYKIIQNKKIKHNLHIKNKIFLNKINNCINQIIEENKNKTNFELEKNEINKFNQENYKSFQQNFQQNLQQEIRQEIQ